MPTSSLPWDPEIDTPATIVVAGAGITGIETALYARALGYAVHLIEQQRPGHTLNSYGGTNRTRWGDMVSPLGLAALQAHGRTELPAPSQAVSQAEFVEQYLLPVARTDLLHECIQVQTSVESVSRCGFSPGDPIDPLQAAEQELRVLFHSPNKGDFSLLTDVFIDCAGRHAQAGLAPGGGQAAGESASRAKMLHEHQSTSIDGGQTAILWGRADDCTALKTALSLADKVERGELDKLFWLAPGYTDDAGPQAGTEADTSLQRLKSGTTDNVVFMPGQGIERIQYDKTWRVTLIVREGETVEVTADQFVDVSPRVADWSFATPLMQANSNVPDVCRLATSQPHYYVLGDKLEPDITPSAIHSQIRSVFQLIGGRTDLDLYRSLGGGQGS